ncbi:hypothetical protein GCM10007301_11830 [Azorhizobium oxalatiphilum]|uniref:Uncharacterized protein n=1 Tax=Azorhizobium oxalatiphilum TaxID=980631 RepID=A0A917BQN3_9HYPH|nr:hypothetical protein [Azorhizobium oxalatiphilum]GGF53987.1 hypothetical protein GCM10007301_11830 [Azorhizobium oxalatiphilum]
MIFDSPLALKALREVAAGELLVVDWTDARGVALVISITTEGVLLIPLSDPPGGTSAMEAVLHGPQAGTRCLSYGHDWVLRPMASPALIAFEPDPGPGAGVVHLTDAGPVLGFRQAPAGTTDAVPVAGYNLAGGGTVAAIAPPYASIFDWDIYPSARAAADPDARPLVSFRYKGVG